MQSSYVVFLRYFSVSKFSSLSLCALLQTLLWISVSSQPVSLCLCVCVCICKQCFHIYLHAGLFHVKQKCFEHTGFSSCFPHNIFTLILPFSFSEVLLHNLGKFSDNSLLQNAFKTNSFLSDFIIFFYLNFFILIRG